MGWEPCPPNPLQHESYKTTLESYASKGCEDKWKAQVRCCEKYASDPDLRKPWMEQWLNKRQQR